MKKTLFHIFKAYLTFCGIGFTFQSFTQPTQYPCADFPGPNLLSISESGIYPFKVSHIGSSEGNILNLFDEDTIQSILLTGNPYNSIEIDLGQEAFINGVQIWQPSGVNNLSNFYVYFTDTSIQEKTQQEIQNDGDYRYIQIDSQNESGDFLEANYLARYITIINFSGSNINLNELKIKGKKEICNNGLDDDCDEKIDCQDVILP